VGDTLTVAANGIELAVTVERVIDPASGADQTTSADADKRFVGVRLLIADRGPGPYDGSADNSVNITGSDAFTYSSDFNKIAGCVNFNDGRVSLAPGASSVGCVVIQVPAGVRVTRVRFTLSSGIDTATTEWLNP
jgi:hypothetical protein